MSPQPDPGHRVDPNGLLQAPIPDEATALDVAYHVAHQWQQHGPGLEFMGAAPLTHAEVLKELCPASPYICHIAGLIIDRVPFIRIAPRNEGGHIIAQVAMQMEDIIWFKPRQQNRPVVAIVRQEREQEQIDEHRRDT